MSDSILDQNGHLIHRKNLKINMVKALFKARSNIWSELENNGLKNRKRRGGQTSKKSKKSNFHRNIILTGPFCTVFHAESEFHNETCQNTLPKVENDDFSKK